MKNVLILHGTANNSQGNWFPWLKAELEKRGYNVWSPDLPQSVNPDEDRYIPYILSNKDWKFTKDTIIVGHSSGGVTALKLLQRLPSGVVIDRCITAGAFIEEHGWKDIVGLFRTRFDFKTIKKHAKHFIVFHSDDDPYVPVDDAERFTRALNAEYILLKDQGHFNLEKGSQYRQFPELLEKILE